MGINESNRLLGLFSTQEDKQKSFFDFVYSKISRDTRNRQVKRNFACIDIIPDSSSAVKVIPINKAIDVKRLDITKDLEMATNIIKEKKVFQIYLVYPKNENFTKQMQIKIKELEACSEQYIIKIIPYSLKSILRKQRICSGNSNILCK